ncbi:YrhK family protein [Amycolatopsis aidingensis]|uniref:YrhK family protein n=1 Tax=Amycolatopsis aidingensis TaxID=2842453 RepID=UPI001C0B32B3|nr:YrhK family protein [Amycolatopsis aidingensis]
MPESADPPPLLLSFGHEELVIRQRYEVASIVNDILIAFWFVLGSVFFFYESLTTAGTWFFLIGSIELMIRPVLRLSRRVHLRRVRSGSPGETAQDF